MAYNEWPEILSGSWPAATGVGRATRH